MIGRLNPELVETVRRMLHLLDLESLDECELLTLRDLVGIYRVRSMERIRASDPGRAERYLAKSSIRQILEADQNDWNV